MTEQAMGTRRFGRVNWLGMFTLAERETRRFLAIWTQTVLAPVFTAGLFVMIFTLAIGPTRGEVMGLPFTTFLVPGIMMMSVIQNAFANTSSSIMSSKVQGNIVDTLMPPLSGWELTIGYLAGGVARGFCVAIAILAAVVPILGIFPAYPLVALLFAFLGAMFMGALGIMAAILAVRFDQMAAITNFVITPLAFLSGTFYSVENLPIGLKAISHVNPVFYLIDGARYGMVGVSDSDPRLGFVICLVCIIASVLTVRWMLASGYRLKP